MPLFPGIFASAISGHLTPADAGSYYPLGEFTLSAAQANVEFTNIPQTYTHLQIRAIARSTFADVASYLKIQTNSDTGNNYANHGLFGNGASAGSYAVTSTSDNVTARITGSTATASIFGAAIWDILDYKNTNKYKTFRALSGDDQNGSGQIRFSSGVWLSTSAITSLRIVDGNGGNISQYSSFALYGVL